MSNGEKTKTFGFDAFGLKAPDLQGWALIFGWLTTAGILYMVHRHPGLIESATFVAFVSPIIMGTYVKTYTFLFSDTKSGAETAKKMADTVIGSGTGSGTPTAAEPVTK